MYPPEKYAHAVARSEGHVQVAIETVVVSSTSARVCGHVIKVFRGSTDFQGRRLELEVPCVQSDSPRGQAPSGVRRIPADSLRVGRVLEALVSKSTTGFEIPLGLCNVIDSTTDSPALRTDFKGPSRPTWRLLFGVLLGTVALLIAWLISLALRR